MFKVSFYSMRITFLGPKSFFFSFKMIFLFMAIRVRKLFLTGPVSTVRSQSFQCWEWLSHYYWKAGTVRTTWSNFVASESGLNEIPPGPKRRPWPIPDHSWAVQSNGSKQVKQSGVFWQALHFAQSTKPRKASHVPPYVQYTWQYNFMCQHYFFTSQHS